MLKGPSVDFFRCRFAHTSHTSSAARADLTDCETISVTSTRSLQGGVRQAGWLPVGGIVGDFT